MCFCHKCFVHSIFLFWFLVTFGDELTKIQKYHVIFVYIFLGKMGKTEKKWIENQATKVTKIPKRWKYGMKQTTKYFYLALFQCTNLQIWQIFDWISNLCHQDRYRRPQFHGRTKLKPCWEFPWHCFAQRCHLYIGFCVSIFLSILSVKVEIFLEQREVAFLSPSKNCENFNFSTMHL